MYSQQTEAGFVPVSVCNPLSDNALSTLFEQRTPQSIKYSQETPKGVATCPLLFHASLQPQSSSESKNAAWKKSEWAK